LFVGKIFATIFILVALTIITGCATATPLTQAAGRGDISAAKDLIDKGANVNERDAQGGMTALTAASAMGHVELANLLIDKGANIDSALDGCERYKVPYAKTCARFLERRQSERNQVQSAKSNPVPLGTVASTEVSPIIIKSDIDELPTIKTKPNRNAYAIVIGIENYRQKLPKADFATQDAQLVADYLIKAMGYPEENVITLLNDRASNVDLAKYFEKWLPNNVETSSSVFIYFSGHGAPNPRTGDAYLVPYDGDPAFIDQTGYSLKRMYEALGKLPAKEIIVALDSCFSGAGGRSVLAEGARPLVMNMQSSLVLSKNMTVMAAASGDQISSTYKDKGHGLFTYFMLKGIKNEDVVKPDGSVAISDLFGYLKPQVERIARKQYNNEQTPQLIEAKKN
jgi:hypothetical protein